MSLAPKVIEIVLGLAFLAAGLSKLLGTKQMRQNFLDHYHYSLWFMRLTGLIELAGAVLLFVGVVVPILAAIAGLGLSVVMVGALATHARIKDAVSQWAPAFVLLVLALFVTVTVWGSAFSASS